MKSAFEIKIRRGVVGPAVLQFYDAVGLAKDVSALTMNLNIYTNDGRKTLIGTRSLSNTSNLNEKSLLFLSSDVALPGQFYCELDVGAVPPSDGAWGWLLVEGQ